MFLDIDLDDQKWVFLCLEAYVSDVQESAHFTLNSNYRYLCNWVGAYLMNSINTAYEHNDINNAWRTLSHLDTQMTTRIMFLGPSDL